MKRTILRIPAVKFKSGLSRSTIYQRIAEGLWTKPVSLGARAVAIWKNKAERLIAQVQPKAYREAAKFLHKAGVVMAKQNNRAEWDHYLGSLRETHARKRRLLEILDGLDEKLIMKKGR